jgi:hypothetical protein
MVNSLIKNAIGEINQDYHPGTLPWVKRNRSSDWQRMIALEDKVNRLALQGNENELKEALREYKEFVFCMVKIFKTLKGQTGNLFQQGLGEE